MSPRPRKASDETIFAAAVRVMERAGPADLTLADIAAEAGVTAGALVQRFGSKRDLLVAMSRQAAAGARETAAAIRARHRSPLAALRALAVCFADLARSPEGLARNLAYFQLDLADPDLYAPLLEQARATREAYRHFIAEAIDAGELAPGTDARRLARLVDTVVTGALMTWAIHRAGTAARWLRAELDSALEPYRHRPPRGAARPKTPSRTRRPT